MKPTDIGLPAKFTGFRPGQLDTIMSLAEDDHTFNLLDAGTGVGKSLIYVALSKLLDARALILVATKGLQDQLMRDFESIGMVDIRGHGNYPCAAPSRYEPVCRTPWDCNYKVDVDIARRSNLVVTNYAYWMALARYSNHSLLGDFDLLVCDECHGLLNHLTDGVSVDIHRSDVRDMLEMDIPNGLDNEEWEAWLSAACRFGDRKYPPSTLLGDPDAGKVRAFMRQLHTARGITTQPWTMRGERVPNVCPVWPARYADAYVYSNISKVVLCSATVPPSIRKYVGIPKDKSSYMELDAGFNPARRPFIFVPTVRVDRKMGRGEYIVWMKKIDKIVGDRLDRKGVIHTRSYDRAQQVVDMSDYGGIMITHKPGGIRQAVDEFVKASPPCVLVSPSVETGFDFHGDICRYQIISKVPFPDGRDPLLQARSDDKGYINFLTAMTIEQMAGRSTRSREDMSETFIIDNHFKWFRKAAEREFSKAFRRTWKWEDTPPPPLPLDIGGKPM